MAKLDIDVETLRRLLRYEPETGLLFWRSRSDDMFPSPSAAASWNARFAEKRALCSRDTHGYLGGRIFRHCFLAHRVAWAIHHGFRPEQVDHINGIREDNRIANLRSVTKSENAKNCAKRVDCSSGVTGVYWNRRAGRWAAIVYAEKKRFFLGYFDNIEDAAMARREEAAKRGFHPNHGTQRYEQG